MPHGPGREESEGVSAEGAMLRLDRAEILKEMKIRRANNEWLDGHREELRQKYPDRYVAVFQESVVDQDTDFRALVSRLRKTIREANVSLAAIEFLSTDDLVWVL